MQPQVARTPGTLCVNGSWHIALRGRPLQTNIGRTVLSFSAALVRNATGCHAAHAPKKRTTCQMIHSRPRDSRGLCELPAAAPAPPVPS